LNPFSTSMMKPHGSPPGYVVLFLLGAYLRDGDLWSERIHAPALAEAHALFRRHPAEIDPRRDEPSRSEHRRARARGQLGDVPGVIAVAVRHEDHVDLAERVQVLALRRRLRIVVRKR
jgi:hypothetical protein